MGYTTEGMEKLKQKVNASTEVVGHARQESVEKEKELFALIKVREDSVSLVKDGRLWAEF